MEAFRLLSRSPSIMSKICCRKSKIHPVLHGENVLTHILFTEALCDKLQRPVAFWEVQEAMNIDYLVEVPASTVIEMMKLTFELLLFTSTPKY